MEALRLICYLVGTVCFLVAVFKGGLKPATLDYLALGLVLWSFPTLAYAIGQAL